MTLYKMIKEVVTTKWVKAKCPICGQTYEYPENGYKPKTCGRYDCVHKYLHLELNKEI